MEFVFTFILKQDPFGLFLQVVVIDIRTINRWIYLISFITSDHSVLTSPASQVL